MMSAGLVLLAGLVAGFVLGTVHLALLERAVLAIARDLRPVRVLSLHLARFALAIGGYWMLARIGAGALLCGLAGFQVARGWVLRRGIRG